MLQRWMTSAFHAALAAIEYPTLGHFHYTVNSSSIGPEQTQILACDASRPLRTTSWQPSGTIHVGMKLMGRQLPLADVCTISSIVNNIYLPPL